MLGLRLSTSVSPPLLHGHVQSQLLQPSTRPSRAHLRFGLVAPSISLKTPSRFVVRAAGNNKSNGDDQKRNGVEPRENGSSGGGDGGGDGGDVKSDRRLLFDLRFDLFDPDPDNILAVGLTGLLTWASVQILSQLFFISLAILVAALKYSFIAALLIFILITLL